MNNRYHIKLKQYGDNFFREKDIPEQYSKIFHYSKVNLFTDENGFITYKDFKEKEKNIYFLGDSFVESYFVEPGNRLSDKTNYYLKNQNYSVYNGGMSGSNLINNYNLLVNKILKYPPSIIVLFPGSICSYNIAETHFWDNNCIFTDVPYVSKYYDKEEAKDHFFKILNLFKHTCEIFQHKFILAITPFNHDDIGTGGIYFKDMLFY